jgi:hypothetical protein
MDFYDLLDQVIDLLQQRGRVSYRALKVQFKSTIRPKARIVLH